MAKGNKRHGGHNQGKGRLGPYRAPYRSSEWNRDSSLRNKYGITSAQYDEMLQAQNFGCAICGAPAEEGKALSVDHDHTCCPQRKSTSGHNVTKCCGSCTRGLLCFHCNTALGHFRDDPNLMARAIVYLTEWTDE
jgi:hypothetical protein